MHKIILLIISIGNSEGDHDASQVFCKRPIVDFIATV